MLTVSGLTKRFGDRLVLDGITFTINPTDRVALVGPNGAGKSTLLAIVSGNDRPDGGTVSLQPNARLGYLRQGFADHHGGSLADLLSATSTRHAALVRTSTALERAVASLAAGTDRANLARYENALEAFEGEGGHRALDDLSSSLAALGVADVPLETSLSTLSGGQKTRAGLAALLADGADMLLLDEPTNHLDIDGLLWLERYLSSFRGAVLTVSHDRTFLDRVATTTFELDDRTRRLTSYVGNYSDFAAAKNAAETARLEAFDRQRREIARIERDVQAIADHARRTERGTQHDYLRARAKKVARTAKVRERRLERLLASEDRIERPERRWGLALDFGERPETGRDVAIVSGASVALGGRSILNGIDLHVRSGERIAVTGPNGSGKSTLVRLLCGDLAPASGAVRLGSGVVVGRYAQEQETLDPRRTVLDQARLAAAVSESDARAFLHRFLFSGDAVFQAAGQLSYGERARLALALLVLRGATFLVLDEPLNHLDLPSRERFEEALAAFPGTFLIVLHDRYAIARLASRVVALRDGRLQQDA